MQLRFTAKLIEKVQLNSTLYKLALEAPEEGIEFEPGQFMSIAVEGFARRSYSMANPPSDKKILVTYVDTTPQGPGSRFCEQVEVGADVDLLAPLGRFYYIPGTRPVYFFATGTGIVPFLSMIKHELAEIKSGRDIYLFFGVKEESSLIELETLKEFEQKYPNFHLHIYVSRSSEWQGNKGRITHGIADIQDQDMDAYICGGREMIEEVEQLLLDKGVPKEQIYYERFY
jgi:ferredoxin-NADP reductase